MRAYERFLRYAKISTASEDGTGATPTTARQLDLARLPSAGSRTSTPHPIFPANA